MDTEQATHYVVVTGKIKTELYETIVPGFGARATWKTAFSVFRSLHAQGVVPTGMSRVLKAH